MAAGLGDLTLAATTLWEVPVEVRARAALAAGFTAIGVHHRDVARWRAGGATDAVVANRVRAMGIRVDEVGFVHRWASARADAEAEDLLPLAALLGAHRLVTGLFENFPYQAVHEGLRRLCRLAARLDLQVALEFFSFGGIPTLGDACRLIAELDEPNLGLLVDTWQVQRGEGTLSGLAQFPDIPLMCVQLADASSSPWADIGEESRHARLMPGAGVIDLSRMLRVVRDRHAEPAIAVEVISDDLAARDPFEVARSAAASVRAVLAEAGW
jgi:sugar phosphate isomerase/epimerase